MYIIMNYVLIYRQIAILASCPPSWHGPDYSPAVVIVGDRAVPTVLPCHRSNSPTL